MILYNFIVQLVDLLYISLQQHMVPDKGLEQSPKNKKLCYQQLPSYKLHYNDNVEDDFV